MKKITFENILKSIKTHKKYVGKSAMSAGNEYLVTLNRNHKQIYFSFHDNQSNDSDIKDWLYCLIVDRSTVCSCPKFTDWCDCLGYSYDKEDGSYYESKEIYDLIKENNRKLNSFFTRTELKVLSEAVEEM